MSSTGLLVIDTQAIASNWHLLRKRVEYSKAICAAVVKADAYGLGMEPVVLALVQAGCRYFFVATLDEAVELRGIVGDQVFICVLGGLAHGEADVWFKHQLIPVLFDVAHIDYWVRYCNRLGCALPCILKVDTGMHRLGMSLSECNHLLEQASHLKSLNVLLFMSHLACADELSHPLNQKQLSEFSVLLPRIKQCFPRVLCSLANSSGIFLGEAFHFDLVRPGAALYGVNPISDSDNPMNTVVRLQLPVMQIKTITVGETVGYGATFVAQKETRIAVVFGGYGDGLSRLLSACATGYCGKQRVPMIGRVSMDSIVFDISSLNAPPLFIEVLNDIQTVDVLAGYMNTIGYEILTSLGRRYHRHYINNTMLG